MILIPPEKIIGAAARVRRQLHLKKLNEQPDMDSQRTPIKRDFKEQSSTVLQAPKSYLTEMQN